MKISAGLFDHMVLQRDKRNRSAGKVEGFCFTKGSVKATAVKGGKTVKGFGSKKVGYADGFRFSGQLAGLPVGGPYQIELWIEDSQGNQAESLSFKDVLVGDVWVLGGQSNMQGRGILTEREKPHPLVRAFYMDDAWRVAEDPLHNMWATVDQVHIDLSGGRPPVDKVMGTGPGVSFGREMQKLTKIPQGLLVCGHGGTSMAQWSPQLKNKGGASLYGATLRRFRKNGSKVAGIVWYQGESDADGTASLVFGQNMIELVRSFRKDLGDGNLPLVMVQLGRVIDPARDPKPWNLIQETQRTLPQRVKRLATVPAIDLDLEDNIHVRGKEQCVLGRRLARAMHFMLTGKGYPEIQPDKIEIKKGILPDIWTDVVVTFKNVAGRLQSKGLAKGFALNTQDYGYRADLKGPRVYYRTLVLPNEIYKCRMQYGAGCNPACNVTDSAGRSLPVFGPMPLSSTMVASTGFIKNLWVSKFMPSAGRLENLSYPKDHIPLGFAPRMFGANFCDLHLELGALRPKDVLVYFLCRFHCDERMSLFLYCGYDGPTKIWVDGQEKYYDPDGCGPAKPDDAKIKFKAGKGRHEVLVGLGSDSGEAWGVFLDLYRLDVPRTLLKKGEGYYKMPRVEPV